MLSFPLFFTILMVHGQSLPNPAPYTHPFAQTLRNIADVLVEKTQTETLPFAAQLTPEGWEPLDLKAQFNHDTQRWLEIASLPAFPSGLHREYGIPFLTFPPVSPNCIRLRSARFPEAPAQVDIPVNRRTPILAFLHASAWTTWGERYHYTVHYADGGEETIEIIPSGNIADGNYSGNIQDWHGTNNNPVERPHARGVPLPDPTDPAPTKIRYLHVLEWANPRPEQAIRSISLHGGDGQTTLFVFAITTHKGGSLKK